MGRFSQLILTRKTRRLLRSVPSRRRELLTSTHPTSSTRDPASSGLHQLISLLPLPQESRCPLDQKSSTESLSRLLPWTDPSTTFRSLYTLNLPFRTPTLSFTEN